MGNEIAKKVPGTTRKASLEKNTIMRSLSLRMDYMFERGTVVWAAGSPCNVIARLRNDRHVLAHYLLGLYLMCGVSWCCR